MTWQAEAPNINLASMAAFGALKAALGLSPSAAIGAAQNRANAYSPLCPPDGSTPTLSLASANPGTTPTLISAVASSAPNTKNFVFSGGKTMLPSNTYPFYTFAGIQQFPIATLGYGKAVVEFECDDYAVTFQHFRSQSATTRVLCNGVELFRIVPAIRAATAQGGSSSTITLDAGASALNNFYTTNWARIVSGTGAGQSGQILSYVGSTKVATMATNWSTSPDATSVFEITLTKATWSNSTQTGWSTYFPTVTWQTRAPRLYKVEHFGQPFAGIYVSSAVTSVSPCVKGRSLPIIWGGDSFGGTGIDLPSESMAGLTAQLLGGDLINLSIGGTGVLNMSSGAAKSFNLKDRLLPPANAWFVQFNGATGGSFTVTQGANSATVNIGDSLATMQASFDAAFGAGAFIVVWGSAATQQNMWIVGQGATGAIVTPMTANFGSLTGNTASTTSAITQWTGDLELHGPRGPNGLILPFLFVLATGHNDTTSSGFTAGQIQAAYTALISGLLAKYPQMQMVVIGNMFLPGGSAGSDVTTCNAAILAACNAALPLINGVLPFVDTVTVPWFTGTGYLGSPQSNGNSDICCSTDGIHPAPFGHYGYGVRIARALAAIFGMP